MTSFFKYILTWFWRRLAAVAPVTGLAGVGICTALAQGSAVAPASNAPATGQSAAGGTGFVVVLDAAHGGDDVGGQLATSVAEKTVTLALSVRLRSLLTARGFQVVTTREGNVSLDSVARAQIANHARAQACLSIHASEAGSGVHIFVSSLPATEAARFLAWKTAQSAFVARSLRLAGTVNSALEHASVADGDAGDGSNGGSSAGPIPATLGRASLPGLDSMTCPAVAVEVAPLRDADGKVLTEVTDPQYQSQVVETLAAALLEWKTDEETEIQVGPRSDSRRGRLP